MEEIESAWIGFYAQASTMIKEQKAAIKAKESQTVSKPLVSVCITHYNRPRFLQLALASVEALTYTNFEVVLVDDGSTTQQAKEYVPVYSLSLLFLLTNSLLAATWPHSLPNSPRKDGSWSFRTTNTSVQRATRQRSMHVANTYFSWTMTTS